MRTLVDIGSMVIEEVPAQIVKVELVGGQIDFHAYFPADRLRLDGTEQTVVLFGRDGRLVGSGRIVVEKRDVVRSDEVLVIFHLELTDQLIHRTRA